MELEETLVGCEDCGHYAATKMGYFTIGQCTAEENLIKKFDTYRGKYTYTAPFVVHVNPEGKCKYHISKTILRAIEKTTTETWIAKIMRKLSF